MSTPRMPLLVDAEWLHQHLADPALVVVDATNHLPVPDEGPYVPESGKQSYQQAHIPGAVFADPLTDFADPDEEQPWTVPDPHRFAAAAGALGIGDGAKVVVYDAHDGFWATRFWWHLRLEGFADVAVLDGGLPAWRAAGYAVTDEPTVPTARTFTGVRRPELLRSTDEMVRAMDDSATILVNVLDEPTYRGEKKTYARHGHIPGSINVPVFGLRDPQTGLLRPLDDLRKIFDDAGLLATDHTVVTYCGGGIAATATAHALALLGREDVAVYDGSMTAWVSDPDRPLVTGPSAR